MENKIGSCMISTLVEKNKKGKIDFEIPIQRESGIWKKEQKSLLIDSILKGYDIPSVYLCKDDENNVLKVIDGKQRLTCVFDFCNDKFKLSEDLTDVYIGDTSYEISGKSFSELPEILQEKILDREISIKYLIDFSDEEIEEQFYRLNNGSSFSNPQKATVVVGSKVAEKLKEIAKLQFWDRTAFTAHQKKDGKIIETILKCFMIMINYDFKTFGGKDVLEFCEYIKDKKDTMENLEILKSYFESLDTILEEDDDIRRFLKPINIPTLVYCMATYEDGNFNEKDFSDFLNDWVIESKSNAKYICNCGQGSTNKEKVKKRCSVIIEDMQDYFDDLNELNNCD